MEPAKLIASARAPTPHLEFKSRYGPGLSALLFFALFVFPLIAFLKNLVIDGDWVSLNFDFVQIVWNSLVFTLIQSSLSAVLACAAGLALGIVLMSAWLTLPALLRGTLRGLGLFYFVMPGVVMASITLEVFKRLGLADQGYLAVIFAHALMNVLFIAVAVAERSAAFQAGSGRTLLDAAAMFGASPLFRFRIFFERLWREQLKFFAPLVFLWSASSFATVIMLGGSPSRSTPEVLLFYSLQHDSSFVRVFLLFLVQAALGLGLYRVSLAKLVTGAGQESIGYRRTSASPKSWICALALAVLFAAPFLRIGSGIFGAFSNHWNRELGAAALSSLVAAMLGSAFAAAAFLLLLQSGSRRRRLFIAGCGLSTTMLATLWSQLHIDHFLEGDEFLQLALLGLATAVAFTPLLALWIELRIAAIPRAQIDAALLLGCPENKIPHRVFLPQCRDICLKAMAFVALATIGELSFAGIFVFDTPLLATLSKSMALRYDFSGNQIILGIISLLCVILVLLNGFQSRERAPQNV